MKGTLFQVGMGRAESLLGGTLESLQVTAFADFCLTLGESLDTSFEHPSAKREVASLPGLTGKMFGKCHRGRCCREWFGDRVAGQSSTGFNLIWKLFP